MHSLFLECPSYAWHWDTHVQNKDPKESAVPCADQISWETAPQDFTGGRGRATVWMGYWQARAHPGGNKGWSISGPHSNHEVQNLKASAYGNSRCADVLFRFNQEPLLHIPVTISLALKTCFSPILCVSRSGVSPALLWPLATGTDMWPAPDQSKPNPRVFIFFPWKEVIVCVCRDGGTQILSHLEEVEMVEQTQIEHKLRNARWSAWV